MEIKIKDSKNIEKVFYIESLNELWVFFKSKSSYVYEVNNDTVDALLKSKEPSKYFYDNIREDCKFRKIY